MINKNSLLPYRILDFTDEKGALCGRILADLGADVIKIEKPGGDTARSIGPYIDGIPDPEKSLFWFAYNANKRGITLDIESSEGQKIFRELVGKTDVIIESFPPGYMDKLGLDYGTLSTINTSLIMTSITPFGQSGPYRDFKASDLVCMAMSGFLYMTGDTDRAPIQISLPQAYFHGSSEAAVATLIALYHREATGEGQYIDISIQHSIISLTANAIPSWEMSSTILPRVGNLRGGVSPNIKQRQLWKCKDGYLNFWILGGGFGEKSNRALTQWMAEEGMTDAFIDSIDWHNFDQSKVKPEDQKHLEDMVAKFFMMHTKEELFQQAVERKISMAPVSNPKDILENPQLKDREFFVNVKHDELGKGIIYPGSFVKIPTGNQPTIRHRAPLIGEHNQEIFAELHVAQLQATHR